MSNEAQLYLIVIGVPFLFCVMCTIVAAVSAHYSKPKSKKQTPGVIARTFVFLAKSWVRARRRRAQESRKTAPEAKADTTAKEESPFSESPAFSSPIAIRHRCFRKYGRKIYVADYADGVSTATCVKRNGNRVRLGEAPTSSESDLNFIASAKAC